jgi:hypothetical protein
VSSTGTHHVMDPRFQKRLLDLHPLGAHEAAMYLQARTAKERKAKGCEVPVPCVHKDLA